MKWKAKWVLTRLFNGSERRFNSREKAVEFAKRQCAKWGFDDASELKLDEEYSEVDVGICSGNRKVVYYVQLDIEWR